MKKLLLISCLVFLTPLAAQGQNVPFSDITLSSRGTPVGGAPIAVCNNPGLSTTAAQVISNIAVLTMSSNPITAGFVANQAIAVSGFTGADTYFNGGTVTSTGISNNFLILSVTSTQITYALTHANASATTNGSVFQSGSQGQACAPLASITSDSAGLLPITQPGLTSSGLGNYQFYGVGGTSYYVQFYGATIGEILKPVVLPCGGSATCTLTGAVTIASPGSLTVSGTATLGNGSSFSAVTFSNHNNQYWAGPGATPTIDQAVTACGALPGCIVHISPGYTGPESVNLTTNSIGYLVYVGVNNITIQDYRSCQGTPGNGFACPIYGSIWGGRLAGQRNRMGISYVSHNETDSAFGANAFNWIDGTFPSNGGGLGGNLCAAELHDTVTVGASTSEIAACAVETDANATTADNPLYSVYGVVSGVNFTRVGAVQNIITAKAYGAKTCSNGSSTAKLFYCYGFHAEPQTGGTYRNFGFHSAGDVLFENGVRVFASSADTSVGVTATSSGQTGTFTMASNCAANPTFVAGALVAVTGMSVAGYNNSWVINAAGCSGSSWSAFMPGTSNLAAGSGGTAQTTTPTKTIGYGFGGTNQTTYWPLADNPGWVWRNKADSTTLAQMTASFFNVNVNLNAGVLGTALGTTGGPWGSLGLGTTGTNFFTFVPAATAALRAVNINDPGATTSLGLSYNATTAVYQSKRGVAGCTTAASIGGTCATDITVTWGTAFADANYSVTCTGSTPTAVPAAPFVVSGTKLAATVHINYFAITAVAASYATIDCIAVHD